MFSLSGMCSNCQKRLTPSLNSKTDFKIENSLLQMFYKCFLFWIFISGLCVTNCHSATVTQPFISVHPRGDTTAPGNQEILHCSAVGSTPLLYQWWRNEEALSNAFNQESSYRLRNIQRSDVGDYRCLVQNEVGTIMSKGASITVAFIDSFRGNPTSVMATSGQAQILSCPPIESYPEPVITWFKDGSPVSDPNVFEAKDGSLVILEASSKDRGSYTCHAENTEAYEFRDSLAISLTVQGSSPATIAPTIVMSATEVIVIHEVHTLAELECIVNAKPLSDLTITWKKDGITVQTGGTEFFKLTIRKPSESSAGVYQCEATLTNTNYPVATASTTLRYFTPPTFTVEPDSDIIASPVGSTVVLPCQGTGNPEPEVMWYRNAADISGNPRYRILTTGSLEITNLRKEEDGMFQCRISNEVGEDIIGMWLQVKEIAPEFTVRPNNTIILVGADTTLNCEASGAPVPDIKWFRDGTFVADSQSSALSRYQFQSTGLKITGAQRQDSGTYMCVANNTKGMLNVTADLNVYLRTFIETPPQNEEVSLGQTAVIECIIHSDPRVQPTIMWYHLGTLVDTTLSRIQMLPRGSLEIQRAQDTDAGNYECQVMSIAGSDSASASLTVLEVPHKPANLQASISAVQPRTIILSWVKPFNGFTPLLRYIIEQKEDESSFREIESTVDPTVIQFPVTGVKPSRSYQYRIKAENKVGLSETSDASNVVNLPEEPPDDPPQRVVASASSTTSIIVEWLEPDEESWNGPLRGYIIRYRLYRYTSNAWIEENITNPRQTSFTLNELMIWRSYDIQVAAYNRAGVGTYSSSVLEFTLEGTPSQPPKDVTIAAVNSTTIHFHWSPPDPPAINGINQGYKVHAWERGQENNKIEEVIPNVAGKEVYSFYMTDLKKYTHYYATVLCFTNPGNGPTSTRASLRTNEDVPGPVEDLQVVNVLATSLRITWTAPLEVNGVLIGYIVEWYPNMAPSNKRTVTRADRETFYNVSGLTAETVYTFSVWAKTNAGDGEAEMVVINSGTPPVPPEAPTYIYIASPSVQSRSVNLQFTPGFSGHTSISLWTVEALVGDSVEWQVVFEHNDPDSESFVVTGLTPFTKYTFRLIATNIAGVSPPSQQTREIETKQDVPEIAPKELTVRAYSETSLRVRWVPLVVKDWNGEASGYRLTWQESGSGATQSGTFRIDDLYASEYIISNLKEWTPYQVTILAYNVIGDGPLSPITVEWTQETVPSAGPSNIEASSVNHSAVRVMWGEIPEDERNGLILGYKVQYYETNARDPQNEVIEVKGNSTQEVVIGGLKGFTVYSVHVLGITRIGDGVGSDEITIKTLESTPGPPSNLMFPVVTGTSVRLEWDAPTQPNGIIIDYRVGYRLESESPETPIVYQPSSSRTVYNTSGLLPNTYYRFYVAAQTSSGWGENALAKVFTTKDRATPEAPSKPVVDHVESRHVRASWTPGDDGDAPLRYYTIQARIGTGSWNVVAGHVPADQVSFTITALVPFTRYQFRIRAHNDVGVSGYSLSSNFITTKQDYPDEAPVISEAIPYTTTSVIVKWERPPRSSENGPVQGYSIMYRQLSQDENIERVVGNPDTMEYELVNLIKYQNYEIRVAAFNGIGNGPYSRPFTVFVGEAAPSAPPSDVRVNIDSATSVVISWSAPPPASQNGGLQGYKVLYWVISAKRDATMYSRTYSAQSTVVTLDGLQCATKYGIQVKAFNSAGEGPASGTQMAATDEDVAGEVAFVNFSLIRMTSLIVTWGPPEKPCGNITTYQLFYQPTKAIKGERASITTEIPATKTSYTVSGLGQETVYIFRISAKTGSKSVYGPALEKNITTGPQPGSPGPPKNLQLKTSSSTMTLTWQPPNKPGSSRVLRYVLELTEDGTGEWTTLSDSLLPSLNEYSFPYRELKASTSYFFRVMAENAHGISQPAETTVPLNTGVGGVPLGQSKDFYEEWWFLIIVALVGIIIIILVGATLCMLGRSRLYVDKKVHKRMPQLDAQSPDDQDFPALEMNHHHGHARRGARNGNSHYATSNSYRRPPPKPSPGSIQYSEEEESKHYEPINKRPIGDPEERVSLTDRIDGRMSDSLGSDSEIEDGINEVDDQFVNHYASLPQTQNWRQQQQSGKAYSYTDSEPDQSNASTNMYNNGLAQMQPGSRQPIHSFSSFV